MPVRLLKVCLAAAANMTSTEACLSFAIDPPLSGPSPVDRHQTGLFRVSVEL